MKRSVSGDVTPATSEDRKMKKVKVEEELEDVTSEENTRGPGSFDDNLLFEVMKHVDARALGMAACVNKQWQKVSQDERLWELICIKQWPNTGCSRQQLRSVVLALGGFRRLHSLYIWPLMKRKTAPPYSCPSSYWPTSPAPRVVRPRPIPRLGNDEVHLSLSLLSIRHYESLGHNIDQQIQKMKDYKTDYDFTSYYAKLKMHLKNRGGGT